MDPIARTAFYCCGVRAADAASPRPICGDHLAARFMDDEARAVFARFARFRGPNLSNAARHRLVDDFLRAHLARHPDGLIVLLGAGFDTRAFRLPGGRWVELDQPALLARKEHALPADTAPSPLQRVGIDFATQDLAGVLAPWAGHETAVVVLEGVSMYLTDAAFAATARALHAVLPGHTLLCDLMDARFARRYGGGLRRGIRALGGDFAPDRADPAAFVESLGYVSRSVASIPARAVEHGTLGIPRWLFNTLLRSLRDGYRLHGFEARRSPASPSA